MFTSALKTKASNLFSSNSNSSSNPPTPTKDKNRERERERARDSRNSASTSAHTSTSSSAAASSSISTFSSTSAPVSSSAASSSGHSASPLPASGGNPHAGSRIPVSTSMMHTSHSNAHGNGHVYREPELPHSAARRLENNDDDIHMMTVNPRLIDPSVLSQLAGLSSEPKVQAQAYQHQNTGYASQHGYGQSAVVDRSAPPPPPSQTQIQAPHYHKRGTGDQLQVPGQAHAQAARDVVLKARPTTAGVVGSPAAVGGRTYQSGAQGQGQGQDQSGSDNGRVLQLWERQILSNPEVKRKATLAQLYFLDYYFDLLGYLHARKTRCATFKSDTASRRLTPGSEGYNSEFRSYAGRERVLLRKRRTKLKVEQFRIIAQVGQGGYGSVYLARKADTGQVCALKKMKKTTLAKMDEVKHVLIERDILTATKTPWLVKLLYAFQDRDHVYLAMEYVPGGDFRTLLNNSGVLKEEHARFYSAEMFMGINELHKLGYIHRDLKPENFLVDGTGHVKLTDFGLATGSLNPAKIESMRQKLDQVKDEDLIIRGTLERRTMYKSMRMAEPRYADSVVGSPDYMPPEVLRGKTYTYSADYWSLGCILFEFLCGFPPFSGSTPEETWANLKNWQKVLRRPVYDKPEDLIFNLTDPAWDAVTRLIAHPKDRISSIHEIQSLPFYNNLPFGTLRSIDAPFVPMLEGETDVGYFDSFDSPEDMAKYAEVFKKQHDVDAVAERGMGDRKAWIGFTFGKNANAQIPHQPRGKQDGEALQTMF